MKNIKSKLWYICSMEDFEQIMTIGLIEKSDAFILMHELNLNIPGKPICQNVSVSDYFAACFFERTNNLEYMLLEIDPKQLSGKFKKRHTRGMVESECTIQYFKNYIPAHAIVGSSKCVIDACMLFYFSMMRLNHALFKKEIYEAVNAPSIRSRKIQNNRFVEEKHESIWFLERLILNYGDLFNHASIDKFIQLNGLKRAA